MAKLFKTKKNYRTERKIIKLREEAKKPVSWHHDDDPFKDINYIFSLKAGFYGMLFKIRVLNKIYF